jgi:hypothetical protein
VIAYRLQPDGELARIRPDVSHVRLEAPPWTGEIAGASLAVRYTKLGPSKLVEDALNVVFDASTALALVTFQFRKRAIRKR